MTNYLANGDIFGEVSFILDNDQDDVYKVISSEAEVIRVDHRRLTNLCLHDTKLGTKFFMFLCFSIRKILKFSGKVEEKETETLSEKDN